MSRLQEQEDVEIRSALQYSVGEICRFSGGKKMNGAAVSTLTEVLLQFSQVLADDLQSFAKHAKRSGVNGEDVKLFARKDPSLVKILEEFEVEQKLLNAAHAPTKKKRKIKDKEKGKEKQEEEDKFVTF
mmetsp:Transcript_33832/g.43461  ORF Transcript_33832/g.43461 Transcript_33832/m.43461 type:complete len:129 (-) Transcript_33832:417-803(-)